MVACAGSDISSSEQEQREHAAALSDDAGTSSASSCSDADTTCDGVDDDCDEQLDEDCDFGPADCPSGSNVIAGTGGNDWLWGTSGRDCILGYGGHDWLWGLNADDVLVGGPGRDTLLGWSGNDRLDGDSGDDLLCGDNGDDDLDGGDGNDFLYGGSGVDKLHGGLCHDKLIASSGLDELFGDNGSDRILGFSPHLIDGGGGLDACSGTSCELAQGARFCFHDSDCSVGQRCLPVVHMCVTPAEAPNTDATCDGFDDDCDGSVDEDFVSTPTTCGSGECAGTGMTSCVDGTVVDSCVPDAPSPDDATCDGIDDDCDGSVDEDFPSMATSCGVGACAATGATMCVDGAVVDTCTPGTPASDDSVCNGIDDDCDGSVDEDFVSTPTSCEVGGCAAVGATECVDGMVQDTCLTDPTCTAEIACQDASDNDGDGLIDCADDDCDTAPNCQEQSFSMTVPGSANIWGAGRAIAPNGGTVPPGVMLALGAGSVVTFPSVTGTVVYGSGNVGPDGIAGPWFPPDFNGIAGYDHTTRMIQMAGVFLGPSEPMSPAPARLFFADSEFTELAPVIGQIFVIGDGLTSTSVQQRFVVPPGATRLFIGITDLCDGTTIGCYSDNLDSYSVSGEIAFD